MSLLEERYAPPSQRGVLYFNTIPRDMRPQEIRLHFNRYGEIRRMKFIPFPKKARRPGGPLLPLQYKEGWMEFTSASDAQHAAQCMNGQPIDVKRQRRCYGQLWTVRFMDGFTWDSLLEEAEGKRRARRAAEVEARRAERSMNEAYRRMVMQAEQQRKAKRRPREKVEAASHSDADAEGDASNSSVATDSGASRVRGGTGRGAAAKSSTKPKAHSAKKSELDPTKKAKRRRDA
ncbi:Pre-rRNA-processing protein ESF2 [Leishmania donovani]|uniref:RNA_binding_protein_-_putative n=3 Tax=Leishmania donovani species complex TaxID=38574 RepID=A0A6L0XQA1_LEIIN|nr:conserved hypothetical protein [Leishmania infantum JPCM5]XP_003864726.1 hypothetical protein, conserved [Leishmania donovani]CAC9543846.1 RNA_binding_protein_-_putative [Leishmania infantum]AYU82940.1 RNA binding protein, putative [Leishmania donovani]TPP44413.1 hypothetical protein CGC21_6230 [Leishmania donovani]TPP46407.1 hypothetical protein CGC20_0325 [Leishmania donovani]CAJ1992949.1 Pre-rRNA-processing protein ESF2 [Leishmania donovani]|eukprot:XP_001468952.1 conserved hypothetical protein [Leishmania infantum JPCM5]